MILRRVSKYFHENWGLFFVLTLSFARLLVYSLEKKSKFCVIKLPVFFTLWKKSFLLLTTPYDSLGLIRAIFLGDTAFLSLDTTDLFRKSGLLHLVAASGFNCWIVGVSFQWVIRPLAKKTKNHSHVIESLSHWMGCFLFWTWTNQAAPVSRAVIFATLKFFLDILQIHVPFWRLLIIQYLMSLIVLPQLFCSASFQLSFSCLFGLATVPFFLSFLGESLCQGYKKRILNYLLNNLSVLLFTTPITWIFFGEMNFTGLFTNFIAVPAVSFVIMPASLLIMLLAPLTCFHGFLNTLSWLTGLSAELFFKTLSLWLTLIPDLNYAPFRH